MEIDEEDVDETKGGYKYPVPSNNNYPANSQPDPELKKQTNLMKKGLRMRIASYLAGIKQTYQTGRNVKNFLTSPIEKYRPIAIIVVLGLFVWLIELYLFFFRGIRQAIFVYYAIHIFMAVIALAIVGWKDWKGVLFITAFYIFLPNMQFFFDAYLKNTTYGVTKGIGNFFISAFLTPLPFMIWFIYGLIKSKSKWAHRIFIGAILFWTIVAISSIVELEAFAEGVNKMSRNTGTTVTPATLKQHLGVAFQKMNPITVFQKVKKDVALEQEKALEYATGGYYEGKEEEGAKVELGVFIEQIKPSASSFFDDEEMIFWSTLKARTLDDEKPVKVNLKCLAGQKALKEEDKSKLVEVEGEIEPKVLETGYIIDNYEEIDVGCRFTNDKVKQLSAGLHEVRFIADFDFTTQANLKTYFMDKQKKRAMLKEGIDIFKQYGITDTTPIATYTNGPVKIGAETTNSIPIGISEGDKVYPRLGITIENQWNGRIGELSILRVTTPTGIELSHCPREIETTNPQTNTYRIKLSDDLFSKHVENIDIFFSINCIMDVPKPEKILGNIPIATKYIEIEAKYNYELETAFDIEIKESKTPEEERYKEILQLTSDDFAVNLKNINKLGVYIEEVIKINAECLNANPSSAEGLISSSTIYDNEQREQLTNNVKLCTQDKGVLSLTTAEIIEWSADNIITQTERAKRNLDFFDSSVQPDKKIELNNEINKAKLIFDKAIMHIAKIKGMNIQIPEISVTKIQELPTKLQIIN